MPYADYIFGATNDALLGIYGYEGTYTPTTPPGNTSDLLLWLERDIDYQVSGYDTETWEKRTRITYKTTDLPFSAPAEIIPTLTNDPPEPIPGDIFAIDNVGSFRVVSVADSNWKRTAVWVLPVEVP